MGFGTDMLGDMHTRQCTEFTIRSEVLEPIDILRSATSVNAKLLGQEGTLGCIKPGALADLLVVDGNPLEDLSVLGANPEWFDAPPRDRGFETIRLIMKDGDIYKNTLD